MVVPGVGAVCENCITREERASMLREETRAALAEWSGDTLTGTELEAMTDWLGRCVFDAFDDHDRRFLVDAVELYGHPPPRLTSAADALFAFRTLLEEP